MASNRTLCLDDGGQGWYHTRMDNQMLSGGEPLGPCNTILPAPRAVGEPLGLRDLAIGVPPEVGVPRPDIPAGERSPYGTPDDNPFWPLPPEFAEYVILLHHCEAGALGGSDLCYFVRRADGAGPIKIGFSGFLPSRLTSIRKETGSGPLVPLAVTTGGRLRESAYHFQFRAHRLHGEWFNPHPDILAEIARLTTPHKEPTQ